jgi:hypothetical protein
MMFGYMPGGVAITAPSASLASLVGLMSRFTGRPVIDMTGIAGQYDFRLTFAPEINVGPNGVAIPESASAATSAEPTPSLFDAVKQYGLRLEARKAPVEMFIVTHIEKTPTENQDIEPRPRVSVMRQRLPIHRSPDQRRRVCVIRLNSRPELHSASPTLRSRAAIPTDPTGSQHNRNRHRARNRSCSHHFGFSDPATPPDMPRLPPSAAPGVELSEYRHRFSCGSGRSSAPGFESRKICSLERV